FGFAMTFASLPVTEVSSMVSKVVPGVFSSVQDSPRQLRRYFLLLTEAVSYITLPMSVGLALTAQDFVLLALGPKWVDVILPLQILCLYMAINACQMLISHVLLWTGHFRANMWLNILTLVVLPVGFYVGLHWWGPGDRLPDHGAPGRVPHGADPGRPGSRFRRCPQARRRRMPGDDGRSPPHARRPPGLVVARSPSHR